MNGVGFSPAAWSSLIPFSSSSSSSCSWVSQKKLVRPKALNRAFTSDPYVLELAETLEESIPSTSSTPLPLHNLRNASSQSLLSTPWPSRRDEPFRFTDLSFIRQSRILPLSHPSPVKILTSHLPPAVYVGPLSALSSSSLLHTVSQYLPHTFPGADLFWSINGIAAPDLTLVYVPENCHLEDPIHFQYTPPQPPTIHPSDTMYLSNPRVLVVLEKGARAHITEDFSAEQGNDNDRYWSNAAFEAVIGEDAKLSHSYIQTQSFRAAHTKWTSVRQDSFSAYELTEVSAGGKLGRHNLRIQQLGPDTVTELSSLHLSVGEQTQDLHSTLVLDHPRGYSRQLHKCIVAHSQGQAVFDGNIKVNRYAQQTDAGQLTRSLLLEPRATVNVKPNLQIVADDVKCSHGAAISDLEESQLLYFQARGIDPNTARRVLIFAFGGEVIDKFPCSSVRDRVRSHIKNLLDPSSN
ncbi:protein ABCI7, chloroplastic [Vigna radiata var. radiata]|uniref:Protein ABCI7, chloroplastic n=1 Tax=Vigna radiata var. radiata TaxID=3916 RepID=A0A1S3VM05_VIGRR|nr:protein ABCI7, chloroplastic [Vigna radiata var. radiata]